MTPIQILDKQLVEIRNKLFDLKQEYVDLRTKLDENLIHQDNASIDIRNIEGAVQILRNNVIAFEKEITK